MGLKIIRKLDFIIKENGLVIENYFPQTNITKVKAGKCLIGDFNFYCNF